MSLAADTGAGFANGQPARICPNVIAAEELGIVTGQKLNEDIPMEADILAGGSIGLISQVNKRTELLCDFQDQPDDGDQGRLMEQIYGKTVPARPSEPVRLGIRSSRRWGPDFCTTYP